MAEETKVGTTAKRKPAVKRKPIAKRKPAAKRKPVAKKARNEFAAKAQEASRNAFLAGLGFYGKAFDQAQEQYKSIQDQMEDRRKKADKLYKELVKRGQKVEKDARVALKDIELPKLELDSLTDRKKLDKQLKKVKSRFAELKETVGLKSAA
ncbi:MAG: hypothetical protein V2I26_01855 [Halieaceae bacterium]|jgi:predicted nuclease with TOPRIM domain|nr:hypothetical protein [Halieaceae bacterium]